MRMAHQEWQVAAKSYELVHYDEHKLQLRTAVKNMIDLIATKNLKKKTFYTISTNVLCADTSTCYDDIAPAHNDLYLPLEIAILKWSVKDALVAPEERKFELKQWMVNPGKPGLGLNAIAQAHKAHHKIEVDDFDKDNPYVETDLVKVMKEINAFLNADRTVFSLGGTEFKPRMRQDLGSLKWLNQKAGGKSKPIRVYNLVDLYVILLRRFKPDDKLICQGVAECRMTYHGNSHDRKRLCMYHKTIAKEEDGECGNCAASLAYVWTEVLLNDLADALPDLSGDTK